MTESLELAVLSDVVSRLESAGFAYMLTGSVAWTTCAIGHRNQGLFILREAQRCIE